AVLSLGGGAAELVGGEDVVAVLVEDGLGARDHVLDGDDGLGGVVGSADGAKLGELVLRGDAVALGLGAHLGEDGLDLADDLAAVGDDLVVLVLVAGGGGGGAQGADAVVAVGIDAVG